MNKHILSPLHAALLILAAGCAVFAVIAGLRAAGALQRIELVQYDRTVARLADNAPAGDVVIVAIGEEDLARWGWPLPDEKLAELLEALKEAGATAIGVDIYRDNPVAPGSAALTRAFDDSRSVWITMLGASGANAIRGPAFAESTDSTGFADVPVDPDGVVRRALLLTSDGTGVSLSFAARLAFLATGQAGLKPLPDDPSVLLFGDTPVPRLRDGSGSYRGIDDTGYQIAVAWRNGPPVAQVISAADLLEGRAGTAEIGGRVVVLGLTSISIKDNFRTPLNRPPHPPFSYGVAVHAAVVQQLIDISAGRLRPLRSPPAPVHLVMILAAALAGAGAGYFARSLAGGIFFGPGLALAFGAAASVALARGLWLPAVPVAFAWFAGFLVVFTIISVLARQQRRTIATLFSDHMSPELSAQIWQSRDVLLSGGKPVPMRLYTTILFADLAGSTTVGGTAEPEAFMTWASTLLDEMSRISRAQGGFVEKFTGDGILVVFGAPVPSEAPGARSRDASRACQAASEIVRAVERFNADPGLLAPYRVRIGLHSGEVLSGTLGTTGSLQYNVMGDTVNIAARIEAFGKTLGDRQQSPVVICLSDTTAQLLPSRESLRPAGRMAHDDGQSAFEIYELTGRPSAPGGMPEDHI
ncbi:CHASE2 domain-containing protein [Roseobacter ponti]|uniref:Adenylate/guanylate cyclase domain-containing protein n=1 Tax=Roseobacter ponti TaxID=1891787 RepID=A0A858ST40_9RHOB|nr:adenylate/guanylate cyclase domain-containing protein [Roseobacter ponti]QJF51874.1 adenylate/guanylate cyclase domain-containing protein [Roseobacter ponti]